MYGGFSPCLGSWGSWGGFGFGLIGLFINLALVVGIILLVVWAVKKFTASPAGQVQTAGPGRRRAGSFGAGGAGHSLCPRRTEPGRIPANESRTVRIAPFIPGGAP